MTNREAIPSAAKGHRFAALDAWRGICALLVALEHLNTDSLLRENAFTRHSYRFVDFFFVLSGFVIAHAYREPLQRGGAAVRGFLVRRLGRLWPLHVVVLAVLIGVECLTAVAAQAGISLGHQAFTEKNTLGAIPANLLLVHAWGMFDTTTWNGPSWSISTEWFAYLLFAGLCALVPRGMIDRIALALLIGAAIVIAFLAPTGMQATYDYALFRCVFGFMAGVLVRSIWASRPLRLGTAGELAIVVGVVAAVAALPTTWPAMFVTPIFALAVWVFASEDGALSRALRRPVPQRLGAWSYSIYMVHVLLVFGIFTAATLANRVGVHLFGRVDGVATIVGPSWLTAAVTALYLGAVLVVSWLTYRHIELPGQRWAARRAAKMEACQLPASGSVHTR
jgi:peptidoglycan/LPS O-acetylase OafA/YrhL